MGISTKITTAFGEDRDVYIRLNNIECSNHGAQSKALFRAYISKEAFDSGASYLHEEQINFTADVSLPLWEQAYEELKLKYEDCVDV